MRMDMGRRKYRKAKKQGIEIKDNITIDEILC